VNKSVLLTGPRATSIREIASLLQEYTGRRVEVSIVPPEVAIAYHKEKGSLPKEQDWYLENWATWFNALENGEASLVDPAMEKLLGRKPKGIQEMMPELFGIKVVEMDTDYFDDYAK
jgi:hypothetical protein